MINQLILEPIAIFNVPDQYYISDFIKFNKHIRANILDVNVHKPIYPLSHSIFEQNPVVYVYFNLIAMNNIESVLYESMDKFLDDMKRIES
jgi:hypothetical protein